MKVLGFPFYFLGLNPRWILKPGIQYVEGTNLKSLRDSKDSEELPQDSLRVALSGHLPSLQWLILGERQTKCPTKLTGCW